MSTKSRLTLKRLRSQFRQELVQHKLALLRQLSRVRLGSARSVLRLHEFLCFMRAYPDGAQLLAQLLTMLACFAARADLRAQRARPADSGSASCAIHFRFFAGQAQWLAEQWPAYLRLDRSDAGMEKRFARALPSLLTPQELQALVELKRPGYSALDRLRGQRDTDAMFLLRRVTAMPANGFKREASVDQIDAGFVLDPGPGTPSRTPAFFVGAPIVFRSSAPAAGRPELRAEFARAPGAARRLRVHDTGTNIVLARAAMVTRVRSLGGAIRQFAGAAATSPDQ